MNCEVPDEFPDLRTWFEDKGLADEQWSAEMWESLKQTARRIWADGWAEGYAAS